MDNPLVIPQDIVSFLIQYGVCKKNAFKKGISGTFTLRTNYKSDFNCGYSVSLLLHRLGIQCDIESSFSFENLPSGHKRYSSANAVFNWSNIQRDLSAYDVDFDNDLKLLIIAGDSTAIIQILESLLNAVRNTLNAANTVNTHFTPQPLTQSNQIHEFNEMNKSKDCTHSNPSTDNMSASMTTNQSSVGTLPPISGQLHVLNAKHHHYTMHYKLSAGNRFLKMLSHSFSSQFFVSVPDAQRILLSEKHLLSIFTDFKFPDDVVPDMKRYRSLYDSELRVQHKSSATTLSWLEVSIRSNLLSFLHQQKLAITKLVISSKYNPSSSNLSNSNHSNVQHPVTSWMSSNSHNAVKSEMLYFIELIRFGLSSDFRESHLSIIFNAFSTLHAILRALHSMSNQLLEEVADWFIRDSTFYMLIDTVLSLKSVLDAHQSSGCHEGPHKAEQQKSTHKTAQKSSKKAKILSHLGYEIWNILNALSTNNQHITFLSIFEAHLHRKNSKTSNGLNELKATGATSANSEYFAVIQCLLQLLTLSLQFSKQTVGKNRTYSRHLRVITKKLQHENVIEYLISQCSSHLLRARHVNPSTWSPSKIHLSPLLHYQRMLNSAGSGSADNELSRSPSHSPPQSPTPSATGEEAHYRATTRYHKEHGNGERGKHSNSVEADCSAIRVLSTLWQTLSNEVDSEQKEKILSTLQKVSRCSAVSAQIECLEALFGILLVLAKAEDEECTPKVYKLLIFHLVEKHGDEVLRDMMLTNFIWILSAVDTLPINVVIEPLIRQTAYYGACQLHFDLFDALLDHKRLGLKQAMLMVHLIGKICISDRQYHAAALSVLLKALKKYQTESVVHEYCSKFFRVLFSNFVEVAQQQHLQQIQLTPALYEANFQKMEITIKTLIEIAKQIEPLKHHIADILNSVITDYAALFGHIHPLLKILYSALQLDTIDTARITAKHEDNGHGQIGHELDEENGINGLNGGSPGSRHSMFRSDRISTTTSNLNQSIGLNHFLHRDQDQNADSEADRISKVNRPTTPEIEAAIQSAKTKYVESIAMHTRRSRAGGEDLDCDTLDDVMSSPSHSIESSEMSEFEPSPVDTVSRAIADIKMVRAKYQKSRENTLEVNVKKSPSPKKRKSSTRTKSKSKSRSDSKTAILKKVGITKEMRIIVEQYRHIFQLMMKQYLGRKPTAIKARSFDDMKRMRSMLSLAEFNLIFEAYKVSNVLLSKNHLKGILRETAQYFGGNLCSIDNFLDSLCFIAQTATFPKHKEQDNGVTDNPLSAPQQLLELINYMKRQHEVHRLRPIKLWETKPPPKKTKKSPTTRRKKMDEISPTSNAPEDALEEMESEILFGESIDKTNPNKLQEQSGSPHSKMKKTKLKKQRVNRKSVSFYAAKKVRKHGVSEKFAKNQKERELEQKRIAEIKEMRRQRRINEVRQNLHKLQQQKMEMEQEKQRKIEQKAQANRERIEAEQRRIALERERRRQQIEKWKAERVRKEEEQERVREAKEAAKRLKHKLTKQQSIELMGKRQREIEEIKAKRIRLEREREERRQKEEMQRNKYLKSKPKEMSDGAVGATESKKEKSENKEDGKPEIVESALSPQKDTINEHNQDNQEKSEITDHIADIEKKAETPKMDVIDEKKEENHEVEVSEETKDLEQHHNEENEKQKVEDSVPEPMANEEPMNENVLKSDSSDHELESQPTDHVEAMKEQEKRLDPDSELEPESNHEPEPEDEMIANETTTEQMKDVDDGRENEEINDIQQEDDDKIDSKQNTQSQDIENDDDQRKEEPIPDEIVENEEETENEVMGTADETAEDVVEKENENENESEKVIKEFSVGDQESESAQNQDDNEIEPQEPETPKIEKDEIIQPKEDDVEYTQESDNIALTESMAN